MKRILRSWAAAMAMLLMVGGLAATTALVAPPGRRGQRDQGADQDRSGLRLHRSAGRRRCDVPPIYQGLGLSVNAAGGINGHKIDVIYEVDDS